MRTSAITRHPLDSYRWLALPLVSAGVLKLALMGSWFSAMSLSAALPMMFPVEAAQLLFQFNRISFKRLGFGPSLSLGLLAGLFIGGSLFLGAVSPAQAQFFQTTQDWMTKEIPGMPGTMVALVFNVLRGVFVLYIGISIVQVIQKGSQGEDWQTLARTPLIVVVAATMGDALANMVVKGTGGTTTPPTTPIT